MTNHPSRSRFLKWPTEPLFALLEGAVEPLDAIFCGLAEPLEAVLEGLAEALSVFDLGRNPGIGRYRLRLPGKSLTIGRYRSGSARQTHVRFSRPEWTIWKHPGECGLTLNRSGLSFGGSGNSVGLTSRDHSRHPGLNQLSGFRKGYAFLNADTLNLLLLLPDRATFSRWSVGTIAIRAQLFREITLLSFFSVTRYTPTTPWSFSSSRISTSDMSGDSWLLPERSSGSCELKPWLVCQ